MEAADRGASQPAASFTTAAASQRGVWGGTGRAHCASQPVARTSVSQSEHVSDDASFVCVKLNIVSFNFGVPQTMMASPKAWTKHAPTLCRLLEQFGLVCDGDLIFACELGGHRPGATATKVDFGNVVKEALPLSQRHNEWRLRRRLQRHRPAEGHLCLRATVRSGCGGALDDLQRCFSARCSADLFNFGQHPHSHAKQWSFSMQASGGVRPRLRRRSHLRLRAGRASRRGHGRQGGLRQRRQRGLTAHAEHNEWRLRHRPAEGHQCLRATVR